MQDLDGALRTSPTDVANFLACRHKTGLDLLVVQRKLKKPTWVDPLADVLRSRGEEHERRYVDRLRAEGLSVVDLGECPYGDRPAETVAAMRRGADVIVQGALAAGQWIGYADVLRKVSSGCPAFGAWSYEAHDTKLSRETRGGSLVQLCVYTELLGVLQGSTPAFFHVITPLGMEDYRFDEFGAFYRQVRARFLDFVSAGMAGEIPATYPDPVEHCGVCRWSSRCSARRRADDHLSLVAGLGRQHETELDRHGVRTLEALAALPLPLEFKPRRGSIDTYERLREQARLQAEQRESGRPTFEHLPLEPEFGLMNLPEPRPGDLFLDLEGDPFARPITGAHPGESGREYLFGVLRMNPDAPPSYTPRWAFTDAEERAAFEATMAGIIAALEADPSIHVYHYGAYEPAAFKRLMGRYAACEADLDRLLRGRRFVDLYAVVRQSIRAGIEHYSIKDLEPFYAFHRLVELDEAGDKRRLVEIALEMNDLSAVTDEVRTAVEGYNRDDCRSLVELQRWLETLRAQRIAGGDEIPRPPIEHDQPTEKVSERQLRVNDLRARLLDGVPAEADGRTPDQEARYLVAYLLDWHYREDKVGWWEYYRLLELSDEELLDEPAAVAGLVFVERVEMVLDKRGRPTGSVIDRYRYPPQECEIQSGDVLKCRDESRFGTVTAMDRVARTIDVKKGSTNLEVHPSSAFAHDHVPLETLAEALLRLGQLVADHGLESISPAARDLLRRNTGRGVVPAPDRAAVAEYAVRIVGDLGSTTLPIQGPPGSGKTFTGARMICELVMKGKRVGVTATSHKVIRTLFDAVAKEAKSLGRDIRLGEKVKEFDDEPGLVQEFKQYPPALAALVERRIDVLGGTAWLWAREEFAGSVDVLFIDEAGQMSLANALAVSQGAKAMVMLGDPQQLDQPKKGSHPEGVDASALDQVLEDHDTMPPDRGLFLPVTWRLAPEICRFTSEVFYEGKLVSRPGLERQRLNGSRHFDGAGLFVVEVDHDGCRNASDEEAAVVAAIAGELVEPGVTWIDGRGGEHQMTASDILVVAPYNAHVARLQDRFATRALESVRIGTVDKFQGQEAPVVIYSMATSRPEDAPRGMEFLYSLNRLNVATSRAKCVCVLVASPRLFGPECRTPRQMRLANALARYLEMATFRRHSVLD
jgi:uncharacterized protein